MSNFRALKWSDRWTLLREHLFPPADYMMSKYGARHRAWLPVLYLKRIAGGIPKLFH